MINRTDAWRCSDGSCYANKNKAYNQEIKILYQKLPKGTGGPLAAQLERVVKAVKSWLAIANELVDRIKETPKDEKLLVIKEFLKLVNSVEKWVKDATSLIEQQENEIDVEVKRSIDGQGG